MLNDYIQDNFTRDRSTAIFDSLNLLLKFNITDMDEKLEDVAFNRIDLDVAGRIANINSLVNEGLIEVLNVHGILVLDLTDDLILIHNMVDVIKKASEEYDAKFILNRINFELSDANEAIDIYANLVELLTESRADDVLENVYSIEPEVIINLFNLLLEKKITEPTLDDTAPHIDRYKEYLNGRRYGLVYELVKAGMEIGVHDFNSIFLYIEEGLFQLPPEELIFEGISAILISNTIEEHLLPLFAKVSRLLTETEGDSKLLLTKMKKEYTVNSKVIL